MSNVSSVSPHQAARTETFFRGEPEGFITEPIRVRHGLSSAADKRHTSSVTPIIRPSNSADHKVREL